jgi:hypothetical protein
MSKLTVKIEGDAGPFAATCAKGAAVGCVGIGWVGRPIDRVVQLLVGAPCRVASDSGAPQPFGRWPPLISGTKRKAISDPTRHFHY